MPKNRWTLAVSSLLLWVFPFAATAASGSFTRAGVPYTIDVNWETEGELPQHSIIAMTQTRDGYLWLGTLSGLVRFDGIRFTVFDESNTPGLNSSRIVSLFEDSRENLWIGTETEGVALVQGGQVRNLDFGRGRREGRLLSACEDSAGAVWLYTADGQLARHRNGKVDVWRFGAERPSNWRAVVAEKSGPLWVGTSWSLSAVDPAAAVEQAELPAAQMAVGKVDYLLASERGGYWRLADGRVQKWTTNRLERDFGSYPWNPAEVSVSSACEDRQGNLLVGTLGAGLFWFDASGQATVLSTNEGLSHNIILSLLVDREGTLWVGTDGGGLNRVKRQFFQVLEQSRGLVAQSVCEDDRGGLWIGYNGGGVDHWREGELQRFKNLGPGTLNLPVKAVFADRQQRVWAGTEGAGLLPLQVGQIERVPGVESVPPVVLAIHQDRAGRLWLGTAGGLVRWDETEWKTFTTRDGLSSDVVRAIAEDRAGNLWIGTRGGGLNRFADGRFQSFHRQDGLPSEDISSLYMDDEEVLWIGTDGQGMARWQAGRWTLYTKREGLISNSIGYLLEDGQGFLWIGSTAGLMRVRKKALNDFAHGLATFIPFRAYGKSDGLPTPECTRGSQPGACRTKSGQLWFPTIGGLASVDPAQLNPNTNPPPVLIESVLIEGEPQTTNALRARLPQTVTVPAGKESLEIHYTSLNLAAGHKARFKYRLEGHETKWTEAGNIRVVHYTRLPARRYRFQVTACNEDGVWNETGSSLAIIVEPPFWQTWWFLTAVSVCLLGTIVATVHYFSTQRLQRQVVALRHQEALEQERSRIARDIHDQLGASLTQVSLLGELVESDKNSPADVEAHARQISQTARETQHALDEIVWTVNPSNDTLEGLVNYVCKYAQDYLRVAGVRYRLEVPPELPAAPVSPEVRHNVFLAAKEAVTNVVRHAQASSVWIRLALDSGRFTLEIQDDGRGPGGSKEERAQSRNGLRNMARRMEDVGGSFAISPAPEGGTLVRLTAPFGKQ